MECSYHYGFDCQEALGKMGLLTDYSALTNLTMSQVGGVVGGSECESNSVSDVSTDEIANDVGTTVVPVVAVVPVAVEVSKEKVVKEKVKKEKVVKEKVKKEKVVKEKVKKEKVKKDDESIETKVLPDSVEVEGKKVEKVKKEKVVKEKVNKEVKEVLKDLVNEVVSVSSSSSLSEGSGSGSGSGLISKKGRPKKEKDLVPKEKKEKGRPKKEKKETESTAIDDLFANLVSKDVVKEEVEVKKVVNEVIVSVKEVVVPKVDVVNKIEFQGTTYLKSKNTGIIYNMEQDVIGKWNENTSTIDFDEEEEEEYEDE